MTAPPDDTTTDLHAEIATLRARETALAEVLDVINHSMGDPHPVFKVILDKAHRLCGTEIGGLVIYDGQTLRAAATRVFWHASMLWCALRRPNSYQRRLLAGEHLIHIAGYRERANMASAAWMSSLK